VYPALAVARALRRVAPDVTLDFATSVSGIENEMLVSGQDVVTHWHKIRSGPFNGVSILRKINSLVQIGLGIGQSFALLQSTKPDVIFLTGGWVGFPVAIGATLLRIPIVTYVPDIEPARALKALGRFATVITATAQQTEQYFSKKKKVVETGYPLRPQVLEATREKGLAYFGIDPNKRTLLVFGGSRGSRAINYAILRHIEKLMQIPDLQILHVSGKLDAQDMRAKYDALPAEIKARYHLHDYVEDFGLALAVADLVVSRAGAGTIGEFPVFGLPAILIPLAYSWRYQEVNADWLASRNAAIRLDEPQMDDQLVPMITELMTQPERLAKLREGAVAIARRDGAENIARVILDLVKADRG
jgi:UDP-N-acetylglucosamine:LPS N-acetylglucosamine transferase